MVFFIAPQVNSGNTPKLPQNRIATGGASIQMIITPPNKRRGARPWLIAALLAALVLLFSVMADRLAKADPVAECVIFAAPDVRRA